MTVAHKRLTCALPSGFGAGNAVTVTRDTQSGTKPGALDYASPIIDPRSLRRFGQNVFVKNGIAVVNRCASGLQLPALLARC